MEKLGRMVAKLADGGVDFVLVGGFAAVAHGASVMTRDVDVCCRLDRENLTRLAAVLADLHPRHRMTPKRLPFDVASTPAEGLRNLYLETDLCVLDCLSEVDGLGGFADVKRESMMISVGTAKFPILTIDALIKSKEAIGRPHDRTTAAQLRAIKEKARC